MFKLTIFKKDLTTYWVEHFPGLAELNKWLDIEKTRPYWDNGFTFSIDDLTPTPPTTEEIDASRQKIIQREASINRLKLAASIVQAEPNISNGLKVVIIDLIKQSI